METGRGSPPASDDRVLPQSDAGAAADGLSALQQEKLQLFASSPELELLCRENGLSASQFARSSECVTSLDLFLGFWTSMGSVAYFPALRELSIVSQPTICALEGVSACVNLEKLCVTECGLLQIASLAGCAKLKELNLSANKLRRLENLDALVQLEKLWVNENQLERLDGLWRLTKLTQLWAGRNRIDRIDTALNCCVKLTELNLADNKLSSFKGLLSLTNLDHLAVLVLSDPHFGDNPVCRLCNYQTYLMCQLPRLRLLDNVELSARNKQIAEATMIKKKMYYNMRIKAIKRDVHGRIRHAEAIRNQAEHHMETSVSALVRLKKEIERFLIESSSRKNETIPQDTLDKLEKKLDCVNCCLRDRYTSVYRMNQDFDRLRTSLRCTSEMNIARLMLELETGGNIRLEDGKPSDAWFGSCVELMRSRLFLPELQKFGINDIRINRVTRINNRFLRNRFQARMEEVLVAPDKKVKDNVSKKGVTVPTEDTDGDRDSEKSSEGNASTSTEEGNQPRSPCPGSTLETSMEYLFYAQTTLLEDQQLRSPADTEQLFIAENGFRGFSGLGATDFGAAIKLSNSIALLDAPRVTATLIAKGQQVQDNGGAQSCQKSTNQLGLTQDMKRALQLVASGNWDLPCGLLLVAKVFPGYTKCISNADIALAKATSGTALGKAPDFTGVQSLQVAHGGATATTAGGEAAANKQKLYYVFDRALVLPEYFVEYQYVLGNTVHGSPRVSSASPDSLRSAKSPRAVHCNAEDVVNLGVVAKQVDDFERKYRIRRSQSPQPPENSVYSSTDESIARLIQMEPLLPGSATSSDTTVPVVSSRLQLAAASRIKYLSLLGCELEAIPDMSSLNDHLEVLVLSYNKIQGTSNLESLSKLHALDLSYNHLAHLGNLENLGSLETLEVSHNLIRSFDDVGCIGKALGKRALKQLDLRKNGICDSKRYRFHVLQYLPMLTQLDQQTVSQEEILTAQRLVTQLSPPKVWALHCQKTRCTVPLSVSEEVKSPSSDHHPESDDEGDTNTLSEWSSVEELVLNHELLGSIQGLSRAVNLRVAAFSDNAIKRIDGLQACTRLEELSLDDNEIAQIENLEQLSFLKKLHLGRNRLTVIQHLDSLENLIQLSLEENQISSLRGLGSALKLMELYLGNNQIENLKEIQHLKSLPKLTILDLSGNEITRLPDYRLYSVYYLRRVKVLDGVSVSTQDQSNAKQKYSGKLTFELILEKCRGGGSVTPTGSTGENQFGRIVDMDISSSRIREIGRIPGDVFSNVREINLENNQISEISGLEALPRLRVLNLNRNKLERLTPSGLSSDYIMPDSGDGGGKGILACLNLEQLHLAYNQITDMTALGLQFLDSLRVLHLQGNAIVYLAGLECNTELVDLRLDKNRIRQLDPNSTLALRQLKVLNLEDNGLKSLSNFNNMLSLETLELSNNRLTDLEEVDKLTVLPSMVDLRMANNPLAKKHLYRQHVLYKLNALKMLDGKDVYSDEKERIDILFVHERAVVAASGVASERIVENRTTYQTQLVLTPSSIPTKNSSSMGISQAPGIPHNEALTGSVLRKTSTTPLSHGPLPATPPTFPLPAHEVDLSITIGSNNTTTRSLLVPAHNSYRNLSSFGNQSSWQVGTTNPGGGASSLLSSSTATVASALSANLAKAVGASELYVSSSQRRRLSSVHYDQQQSVPPSLQVNGKFGGAPDTRFTVGIVSPQAVVRGPAATIRRAGFNMQPSSTEQQPNSSMQTSAHMLPASSIPSANDTGSRSFSGYVVTFGNQKRYSSGYPNSAQQETTIPYLSTKLQQQVRRAGERQR